MSLPSSVLPLTVYGSDLSYFTGKLETYLRIKGIPYRFEPMHLLRAWRRAARETGVSQMPAVTLADGRWVTDTTPMIAWLEAQQPEPPVVPTDPEQRFFSLLLEDYADEWLWRPAMHLRWHSREGAYLQSRHLADELTRGVPLPPVLKRWNLRRRQRGYSRGDGVNEANRRQVEDIYLRNLDWLQTALAQRPYLLGDSPSLADVAFMGPMFRHFSQDPVPAEIMKQRAPGVWEWVARLWNAAAHPARGDWVQGVPADWDPWLDDIGRAYLPYLCANADAVAAGERRFATEVDGVTYPNARSSAYRVWCLEQLRAAFTALPAAAQEPVRERLQRHHCWEPLWRHPHLDSGVNREARLPFQCSAKMV